MAEQPHNQTVKKTREAPKPSRREPVYIKKKVGGRIIKVRDPLCAIGIDPNNLPKVGELDVRKLLINLHMKFHEDDWESRVEAFETVASYFADEGFDEKSEEQPIDIFMTGMTRQFQDDRSLVINRVCDSMLAMLTSSPDSRIAGEMIRGCFDNLAVRVETLRSRITAFGTGVTKISPMSAGTEYAKALMEGMVHKQPTTRATCTGYLTLLVNNLKKGDCDFAILDDIEKATLGALTAQKKETRDNGILLLQALLNVEDQSGRIDAILPKTPKGMQKRINEALEQSIVSE